MKNKRMSNFANKVTATVMAVAITVSGLVFVPKNVEAAVNIPTEVTKQQYTNVQEYWSEGTKKAPVKEGYLFAGWYKDEALKTPYNNSNANEDDNMTTSVTTAWAKFVPAYVLSVKAQNTKDTSAETASTDMRLVSAVDSLDYKEVGFTVLKRKNGTETLEDRHTDKATTKVFKILKANEADYAAADVFGAPAEFFFTYYIQKIPNGNHGTQVYVRPYWVTYDGTRVDGLSKYAHVEDEYKNYVNVPVNLQSLDKNVAAGVLSVSYDSGALTYVGHEAGLVFEEVDTANNASTGEVKCVGNLKNIEDIQLADGMYINLRFERLTPKKELTKDAKQFDVTVSDFSNSGEELVDVAAWDIQY